MYPTTFAPPEVLPALDPHLGDQLGDELLLNSARKPTGKVKAGLHGNAASERNNPRAWTARGNVD
jgi:hypothetical protein